MGPTRARRGVTRHEPLALWQGEDVVLEMRQSAGIHALGAGLGLALALLLAALGWFPGAAIVALVTVLWAAFLAATRTRCVVTQRRILVRGAFREASVRLAAVHGMMLTRDVLKHDVLVVDHGEGRLVVRDLRDARAVLSVLESLVRRARAPRSRVEEAAPPAQDPVPPQRPPRGPARPYRGSLGPSAR